MNMVKMSWCAPGVPREPPPSAQVVSEAYTSAVEQTHATHVTDTQVVTIKNWPTSRPESTRFWKRREMHPPRHAPHVVTNVVTYWVCKTDTEDAVSTSWCCFLHSQQCTVCLHITDPLVFSSCCRCGRRQRPCSSRKSRRSAISLSSSAMLSCPDIQHGHAVSVSLDDDDETPSEKQSLCQLTSCTTILLHCTRKTLGGETHVCQPSERESKNRASDAHVSRIDRICLTAPKHQTNRDQTRLDKPPTKTAPQRHMSLFQNTHTQDKCTKTANTLHPRPTQRINCEC